METRVKNYGEYVVVPPARFTAGIFSETCFRALMSGAFIIFLHEAKKAAENKTTLDPFMFHFSYVDSEGERKVERFGFKQNTLGGKYPELEVATTEDWILEELSSFAWPLNFGEEIEE